MTPTPFNAATWLVERHVEQGGGDRTALRSGASLVTYADLARRVCAAGSRWRRLGVHPEERVLLVLLDSIDFAVAFLGAMRIGAVPLPVNPLLPGRDLAVVAADSRARIGLVSAERAAMVDELRAGAPELRAVVVAGSDDWDNSPASLASSAMDGGAAADPGAWSSWDESPGFWLSTSGTTGRPKIVMHRHADLRITAEGYAREVLEITSDDVCLSVAPMFHAYGLGNSLGFPLSVGAAAVLEPTRPPTPALVERLLTEHRPTLFFAVPTFYAALLASDLEAGAFASVRRAVSAGEALPAQILTRFQQRFGLEILDGIGSTEMTHIFISNTAGQAIPGSSGFPVAGHSVRILDDHGDEVADTEPGLLWVRGDAAATGYWCRAADSRRTFAGEWVRTGDVYVRDRLGHYRYLGRRDDMMKVGAEWVSPTEVEEAILQHRAVGEVAVVGATGEDGLARLVAFVVLAAGQTVDAEELGSHCHDRLAGFKRPRHVVTVDALPKTATGKIRRHVLRELASRQTSAR